MLNKKKTAVFIDRDGTLGGTGRGMHPKEFEFYNGIEKSIKKLNQNGFLVFMITNQARIGRGLFTKEEFIEGVQRLQLSLKSQGAYLDDYFFCPHRENEKCDCRKPSLGLINQAISKYPNIDVRKSYIIGDLLEADIALGHSISLNKILVLTGCGGNSLKKGSIDKYTPFCVSENLNCAVELIISQMPKESLT